MVLLHYVLVHQDLSSPRGNSDDDTDVNGGRVSQSEALPSESAFFGLYKHPSFPLVWQWNLLMFFVIYTRILLYTVFQFNQDPFVFFQ